jgi:ribonuclease HI
MRFKGELVWVRAGESGELILDADGRAEMKYRESDPKSYRPAPGNLAPDGGGATGETGGPVHPRGRPGGALDTAGRSRAPRAAETAPAKLPSQAAGISPAARPAQTARTAPDRLPANAVEIWTDGACSGNPGPMGIGVVVIDGATRREAGEYLGIGTNNIAELTAIERGLELAGEARRAGQRRLRVYTDSSYAIGVLSKGWKAKANQELIARLRRLLATLPGVEFVKVAGHAGVPENERCDELARQAVTARAR